MKTVQSKSVEKIPNWIFSFVHLRPGGGRCAIIPAGCSLQAEIEEVELQK
jgi:hypothetical protein